MRRAGMSRKRRAGTREKARLCASPPRDFRLRLRGSARVDRDAASGRRRRYCSKSSSMRSTAASIFASSSYVPASICALISATFSVRTSLFFRALSRCDIPDNSTLSVAPIWAGASVGIDFWIGLLTLFWTGEFCPTPLIPLMATPFWQNVSLKGRRLHRLTPLTLLLSTHFWTFLEPVDEIHV